MWSSEVTSKDAALQGGMIVLMLLFAAALVVRRRYFIVCFFLPQAVSRGAARCALQLFGRGAQDNARGAKHVLDRGVQAVAR